MNTEQTYGKEQVFERMMELSTLSNGWYYGNGEGFNVTQVERLVSILKTNWIFGEAVPYVFPTVAGEFNCEARLGDFDTSWEINLKTLEVYKHEMNHYSKESTEETFYLNSQP